MSTNAQAIGFAPGRLNVIGEHTDYNEGFVLPAAIAMGTTARVSLRENGVLRMRSAQAGGEVTVAMAGLRPGAVKGWAAYVAGAVWAFGDRDSRGYDVEIDGTVPLGAGLSSSASVECAVLVALDSLHGSRFAPRELARMAQRAENDFVGVPTGSMDQVASMLGVEQCALLFDVRADSIEVIAMDLDAHGLELLVIDTRAKHALIDGGYADRRATCERAASILGIASLRDIDDLDAALVTLAAHDDANRLIARTRHVVTENARVLAAVAAMRSGDMARLGEQMLASHASLRDDYEVSCAELDVAVDAAMSAGALGARMMGGGFGGSALALVDRARTERVIAAVERAYDDAGFAGPATFRVSPAQGAHVIHEGS